MNTLKQGQSESNGGSNLNKGIEFNKHKENLRKAKMSVLEYGDEVVLIKNSKGEELYDYLLGSIGTIIQRNKNHNNSKSISYIVMFGDLKVDVDVDDIALKTSLEGL